MTILALCMAVLYFAAVGVAFLNDRRRARGAVRQDIDDDDASRRSSRSRRSTRPTWGAHGYDDDDSDDRRAALTDVGA